MSMASSRKPGALRLPPGFRFHPTDEELVLHYLSRKAFSFPLPAAIIPEINLGKYDPWDLPGCGEKESYFFHLRVAKYRNGGRSNRATGSGFWKATGKDKPVVASKSNHVVGMKKMLVFYRGRPPCGSRTDWVMHEYRLSGAEAGLFSSLQRMNSIDSAEKPVSDWVLCRIFMKRRAAEVVAGSEEDPDQKQKRVDRFINFMREHERDRSRRLSSTSSSSGLSCVTELSGENSNGEDSGCSRFMRNED